MVLMVLIVALLGVLSLALLSSVQSGVEPRATPRSSATPRSRRPRPASTPTCRSSSTTASSTTTTWPRASRRAARRRASSSPAAARRTSRGRTGSAGRTRTASTSGIALGNGYEYSLQITPPTPGLVGDRHRRRRPADRLDDEQRGRSRRSCARRASRTSRCSRTRTSPTAPSATTKGKIYAGKDATGVKHNVTHNGTAYADIYAEGDVTGS